MAELRSTIPQILVKVNGRDLPPDAFDAVLEGVVENSLHLPDACTIRIHDNDFKWLDSEHWKEGNEIRVEAGQGREPLIKVFEGEITAVELDLAGMGVATMTVRCMDKAHRLHRGKNRRTWNNRMDSDIVQDIAQEMGLTCEVSTTKQVHDWVMQNNQSNWEFLQSLAQRNGFRLYLEDKTKLVFTKVKDPEPDTTELEWGHELRSFRIRVNSGNQVDSVTVRGWDPKKKEKIIGKAAKPAGASQIGLRSDGSQTARSAFGKAEAVVVDRPVFNAGQADEIAQSVMDDIGTSFIEADGLCYNHPELKAGKTIEIKNIGNRFNGKYVLTSVQHTFSSAEGFSTQFTISGKQPATLLSILGGGGGGGGSSSGGGASVGSSHASKNAGNIVVGIVTDNNDPEGLGRVKLMFPWFDDNLTTFWARIATPMAGKDRGFMFLPEVDDEVLVAFEHGDINRPYVIGCLWSAVDTPPMTNQKALGNGVRHRRIKTRYGHMIDLDDNGRIVVQTKGGQRMTLSDNGESISLRTNKGLSFEAIDQGGMTQIAMFTPKGNAIGINDIETFLTMQDAMGNAVSIDGLTGDVSLKAMKSVSINGGAAVNVSAGMININGAPAASVGKKINAEDSESKEIENT